MRKQSGGSRRRRDGEGGDIAPEIGPDEENRRAFASSLVERVMELPDREREHVENMLGIMEMRARIADSDEDEGELLRARCDALLGMEDRLMLGERAEDIARWLDVPVVHVEEYIVATGKAVFAFSGKMGMLQRGTPPITEDQWRRFLRVAREEGHKRNHRDGNSDGIGGGGSSWATMQ